MTSSETGALRPPLVLARLARGLPVVFLLYLFLVGVGLLESGISAMGEGFQEGLLGSVSHPISGLFAGILATVLVQSSSVSTSTIVGLVGAGTLPVQLAVPMIMGANIGTKITALIASLAVARPEGLTIALVHTLFNVSAVAIIFPIRQVRMIPVRLAERVADLAVVRHSLLQQPST